MKHTTVCGKSADRPIGGTCLRKPRLKTTIGHEPVQCPPSGAADWLLGMSCDTTIQPSHSRTRLVEFPKQAAPILWFIGREFFYDTSIPRISSCKRESGPRWNVIGRFGRELDSLGSFHINSTWWRSQVDEAPQVQMFNVAPQRNNRQVNFPQCQMWLFLLTCTKKHSLPLIIACSSVRNIYLSFAGSHTPTQPFMSGDNSLSPNAIAPILVCSHFIRK